MNPAKKSARLAELELQIADAQHNLAKIPLRIKQGEAALTVHLQTCEENKAQYEENIKAFEAEKKRLLELKEGEG